jgi:hypothetical protein
MILFIHNLWIIYNRALLLYTVCIEFVMLIAYNFVFWQTYTDYDQPERKQIMSVFRYDIHLPLHNRPTRHVSRTSHH